MVLPAPVLQSGSILGMSGHWRTHRAHTPHPQTGSILQGHAVRLPVERQAMEASAGSEGSEEREREREPGST